MPRVRFTRHLVLVLLCAACATTVDAAAPTNTAPLRLIIETDAGGDPDDEQSLVRFLLYVNEWDVEGIIANRPRARDGENHNPARTGLGIVQRLLDAYARCHPNLVRHDPRYPHPEQLRSRTVAGHDATESGVNLLIAAVDRDDPRPLWYSDWGTDHGAATNNLRRALDRVRHERGPDGYAKFKQRLRLTSADAFGEHTTRLDPPFPLWVDTWRPEMDGRRWYHRFSGITARAGGFDLMRDVLTGHGPLGALYPTNTTHWQKEGDTLSFVYLVPTGLSDPSDPGLGGWGGRLGLNPNHPGKPYYWANVLDAWRGTTNRDNTLARWAADLQNDFRARLNWCVQPPGAANHPPRAVIDGDTGRDILRHQVWPGETVRLDASASSDPDGHALDFNWFIYPEASTYRGKVMVRNASSPMASVSIPPDGGGKELHLVLTVRDRGEPPLAAYRRVVLRAPGP